MTPFEAATAVATAIDRMAVITFKSADGKEMVVRLNPDTAKGLSSQLVPVVMTATKMQ